MVVWDTAWKGAPSSCASLDGNGNDMLALVWTMLEKAVDIAGRFMSARIFPSLGVVSILGGGAALRGILLRLEEEFGAFAWIDRLALDWGGRGGGESGVSGTASSLGGDESARSRAG